MKFPISNLRRRDLCLTRKLRNIWPTRAAGIVPYEESAGTHCAFVAKVVEYVASGLPAVSTPLESIRRYLQG